jgi:uncharacterized peroxidase-related enzyme
MTAVFLAHPPDSPEAERLYDDDVAGDGFVMNGTRLWAWRPEVSAAFTRLRSDLMSATNLSQRELGVLVCATASALGDSYCALAWGRNLTGWAGEAVATAAVSGGTAEEMTAREAALAGWARKVVGDPNATSATDVDELRAAGLSDQEIFDATAFVSFRLAFSTVNDALGINPDWQLVETAAPGLVDAITFGRSVAPKPDGEAGA